MSETDRERMFRRAKICKRVMDVIEEAENIWPGIKAELETTKVLFNLRGHAAAQARFEGSRNLDTGRVYWHSIQIRVNVEAYQLDPVHMLEDTIPHEVAHLVCGLRGLDKGHGKNWKAACKMLGGTGDPYHTMKLTPARRPKKFLYRNDNGQEVHFKQGRHSNLQLKKVEYYKKSDGESWYKHHFIQEVFIDPEDA